MKAFLALAFLQVVAFANCGGIQKITEFGAKGEKDILIFTEAFSVYRSTLDRYQYVSFPPKGLVNNYSIHYVKVIDYNRHTADVSKYSEEGDKEVTIRISAPLLNRIEATVEIYGTFNGPCSAQIDNNNKAGDNNNNSANNDKKEENHTFSP